MFEKRMLRRIFGPKGQEMAGGCRGLHNVEPYELYGAPNTIGTTKLRRKRWAEHVARRER